MALTRFLMLAHFLCLLPFSLFSIADTEKASITRDYVDGPFGQIHISYAGDPNSEKTPLLLFHPTAMSGFFFHEYMKEIARDRYVIATDTPGYGRSDPPPEPQTLEALADALSNVPKALGIEQFDILGFNTGAFIAVNLAVQNPDSVRRLILPGLAYHTAEEREVLYQQYVRPPSETLDYVERYWRGYINNRGERNLEHAAMSFNERMLSFPRSHWGYHSVFSQDLMNLLPQVKQPVLIPAKNGCQIDEVKALSELMPNTEYVENDEFSLRGFYFSIAEIVQVTKGFLD